MTAHSPTSRLSCMQPAMQNIPVRSDTGRRIRTALTYARNAELAAALYHPVIRRPVNDPISHTQDTRQRAENAYGVAYRLDSEWRTLIPATHEGVSYLACVTVLTRTNPVGFSSSIGCVVWRIFTRSGAEVLCAHALFTDRAGDFARAARYALRSLWRYRCVQRVRRSDAAPV